MKAFRPALPAGDDKYSSIFEHSAVSLWEEDISRLRARLRELRRDPAFNLRAHVAAHPEFVQEAVTLIEVTDVNQASLRLFEAMDKKQLLGPLDFVLDAVSRSSISEALFAIDEGVSDIEVESTAVTLAGRRLSLIVKTHIPSADATYPRMLVSLIDITARKDAEERALQGTAILRDIIDSTPDAIFVKDEKLRMVLCNAAHARSVGKTPEETCGRTDIENGWSADLVKGNPDKGIEGWEKDDLAALAGRTVRVSGVPSNVGDEVRYFDVVKMPRRDATGVIIGIIGFGRDVTERRRIELDLTWERSLFTLLMDNLPDHFYFKDAESRFVRASRSMADALGERDPADLHGKTDADYFGPEHARKAREDEQQVMRTGTPLINIEERETYPDRPDTWAITTKMPLRDATGDIVGTFGISHDTTKRKRLEERNQQLAALVEAADDAIMEIGMDRTFTVWNKGAERIFGYTADETIGQPTSMVLPPTLERDATALRQRLARGEMIAHFSTKITRKDGRQIDVSITMSAVRNAAGNMVSMASVARDITAQKALNAQLNRVQHLENLATLAAGVAHQFNNVNTVVRGYLDMLRSSAGMPAPLRAYVQAALTGVQKAVDIIDRLLALTEPAGEAPHAVRLDAMTRDVAARNEKSFHEAGAELTLDLAETAVVDANESRLTWVLEGLIGNALDSLLDRPVRKVIIRTGNAREGAYVEVKDTGCGIAEEDMPRVFTPFFSRKGEWAAHGSPQERLKGVGLSLAISSAKVSEYGGWMDVKSVVGAGSTFRLVIPPAGASSAG